MKETKEFFITLLFWVVLGGCWALIVYLISQCTMEMCVEFIPMYTEVA